MHQSIKKVLYLRKSILSFVALLFCSSLFGQQHGIGDGNFQACGGFLVDSGFSASDYGPNEDQTITICAEAPETILNMYWTVFQLGAGDLIEIHDGSTTSAPIIGSYSGTSLSSENITSTNAQGCLTVHFTSDAANDGNFAAEITCGLPCEHPIANITSVDGPSRIKICPGETVHFDASQTQFSNGSSLQAYTWDFDDGATNSSSWPTVSHTFTQPGGYSVQLHVTDNTGCENFNVTDYIVFVSTYPQFDLITDVNDLCQGGTAFLGVTNLLADSIYTADSLNLWISEPWSDIPQSNFSEPLYVPDNETPCASTNLTYSQFAPNEVLSDTTDIASLFMNLEHSFMADLVITLICPNNQTLTLHSQGGVGVDLGEPVLVEDPNQPGVGYDYWFSPTSTSGTLVTASNGLTTLPSGTYQSVQSWTQLIGCPLNGTWTLQICDIWDTDDGNLFEWGLNFNPQLYGDTLSFQPSYGAGCDSTFWAGPGITSTSSGCDFANVVLGAAGSYNFTYTAINDFGCSFDTTITITVDTAPLVSAGEDLSFDCTGGPIILDGGFLDIPDADCSDDGGTFNYTYDDNDQFTWTFCPNNEYTIMSFEFVSGQMENFFERFIVYDGPNTSSPVMLDWTSGDLSGQSWTATNASGCLTVSFDADGIISASTGDFDPWQYIVSCQQRTPEFEWEWGPSGPLSNASIQDPTVTNLPQTTDFVLTGYPVGQPGCFSTDTVTVTVPVDIIFDLDPSYQKCYGELADLFPIGLSGGVAPYTYHWTRSGVPISTQDTLSQPVTNADEYCLEVQDVCGSSLEKCAPVLVYPEIPAGFSVDNYLGCSPHSVVLTSDYTAYQNVLHMIWRFDDGDSATTMGSSSHAYNIDGIYRPSLEIIDTHGCHFSDTLQNPINVYPTPAASFEAESALNFLPETTFEFNNYSLGGGISQWVINATDTLYSTNARYTFPSETVGFYHIWLYESNEFGCMDSSERYVEVQNEMDIYIPNTFTPNNDDINDVWYIQGKGFSKLDYKVDVVDRWGEPVFHSTDPEEVWTGSARAGTYFVPDGIYHYRLEIRDTQHDVTYLREGHVLIVR